MYKKLIILAIAGSAAVASVAKDSDPAIMTVAGKKVPLSEFEYLYNKNNGQQVTPMTVNEYADLFVTYKLKVAAAEAAGIDTTAAFRAEFSKYRNELAEPYLVDKDEEERLVEEAYSHMNSERHVSHIMVGKGRTPAEGDSARMKLDSIRTLITGGADFAEQARRHSIDRSVRMNGGDLGWICAARYPYSFEKVAYETPVGQISEVMETPFGYHIIRVEGERPSRGEVLVRHILKMTRNMTPEQKAAVKVSVDSIYNLLRNGADFAEVAGKESQDPGSAREGGMLPWFGSGMMVPEFESVAFSLENGALSEPFETSYGYHIINRVDARDVASLDEAREKLLALMKRDGRANQPREKRLADLRVRFGAKLYDNNVASLKTAVKGHGSIDSSFVATMSKYPVVLGEVNGNKFSTVDLFGKPLPSPVIAAGVADAYIDATISAIVDELVVDAEIVRLQSVNPDFRNLVNEYHDGMLLFEISNDKVWNRASSDKEGQDAYFAAHRDKYVWDSPKYKGYVVYAVNDSVAALVDDFLKTSPEADSLQSMIKDRFSRMVRVERVLAGKGENSVVDSEMFGGETPVMKGVWKHAVLYGGRLIEAPEETADVRGQVITDYQGELEKRWIEELKSKYPVKVNKKLLKKLQ